MLAVSGLNVAFLLESTDAALGGIDFMVGLVVVVGFALTPDGEGLRVRVFIASMDGGVFVRLNGVVVVVFKAAGGGGIGVCVTTDGDLTVDRTLGGSAFLAGVADATMFFLSFNADVFSGSFLLKLLMLMPIGVGGGVSLGVAVLCTGATLATGATVGLTYPLGVIMGATLFKLLYSLSTVPVNSAELTYVLFLSAVGSLVSFPFFLLRVDTE